MLQRILLLTVFMLLMLLNLSIGSMLLIFGLLDLAFAVVGHGSLFLPVLIFGAVLEVPLVWLTVIVIGRLRANFAAPATP
jgi:hypothetical protein